MTASSIGSEQLTKLLSAHLPVDLCEVVQSYTPASSIPELFKEVQNTMREYMEISPVKPGEPGKENKVAKKRKLRDKISVDLRVLNENFSDFEKTHGSRSTYYQHFPILKYQYDSFINLDESKRPS